MDALRQYYTTLFAQMYSPCGKYLVVGNNYGTLAVFSLSSFLNCDEGIYVEEHHRHPIYRFDAHNCPVYSMASTDELLITGGLGEIKMWYWSDLKKKESKLVRTINILQGDSLMKAEVNALALVSKDENPLLYAGCGDNKVYCWDLESGTLKLTLEGHTEYIHCIAMSNNSVECFTGSEDGSVRIWDTRKKGEAVHTIQPYKQENLSRPVFGKWIGCVALDSNEDWMICGGGPTLCVWHLRSLSPSVVLPTPDSTSTVAFFYDDMIISGGSQSYVRHWDFSGELKAEIPTSASNIYSIVVNKNAGGLQKIFSVSGTSYKVDICTNFMYKDFSLLFD